ncbi:hypothetical protein Nmel_007724 [Mimus melanotis]
MFIYKKGWKEGLGNYKPVSLCSGMEWIILSVITQHMQESQGIGPSQDGFGKGRSCLINLICFYDQVTSTDDEGKAVDVAYLEFSKAFNTISHGTLLEKLAAHGLDRSTPCWVRPWLHCSGPGPESGHEWFCIQNWGLVTSGVPQVFGPLLFKIFLEDLYEIDYTFSIIHR